MSNEKISNNFIKNIIIDDLETGKHDHIITRFPPEPNGYLHIGHAKSICLNFGLAKEFNGTVNMRFDDTNPLKEDEEYVNSIKEDVKWLGFNWDNLYFASDYFDEMYKRAVLLIKKGKAYVCDLTSEEINILAILMMIGWVQRQVTSIENTRMKYTGADFKMTSQANHLSKLLTLLTECQRQSHHMQRLYRRRRPSTEDDLKEKTTGPFASNWDVLRKSVFDD